MIAILSQCRFKCTFIRLSAVYSRSPFICLDTLLTTAASSRSVCFHLSPHPTNTTSNGRVTSKVWQGAVQLKGVIAHEVQYTDQHQVKWIPLCEVGVPTNRYHEFALNSCWVRHGCWVGPRIRCPKGCSMRSLSSRNEILNQIPII